MCKNGCKQNECSDCQNELRRATKKGKNRYKAHGPCQTDQTRTWRVQRKAV